MIYSTISIALKSAGIMAFWMSVLWSQDSLHFQHNNAKGKGVEETLNAHRDAHGNSMHKYAAANQLMAYQVHSTNVSDETHTHTC